MPGRAIDWSVLSGPRVSHRTLMRLAAASGAAAYAAGLTAGSARVTSGGRPRSLARRQDVKQGGELRWGYGIGQIQTLDPAQVNLGAVAGQLLANIFSGLVQFDEELNIAPDLAEDWT